MIVLGAFLSGALDVWRIYPGLWEEWGRYPNQHIHWSKQPWADNQITLRWGVSAVETIALSIGRTPSSVLHRAQALGLGRPGTGTKSMRELVQTSGFCEPAIRRAAAVAKVKFRRSPTTTPHDPSSKPTLGRTFIIDTDQEEAILSVLLDPESPARRSPGPRRGAMDWGTGTRPANCRGCHTNELPHYSRGLCKICYKKAERSGTLDEYPRTVKWHESIGVEDE